MSVSAGAGPRSVAACSVPAGSCADQLLGAVSAAFSWGSTGVAGRLTALSSPQVRSTLALTEKNRIWNEALPCT